MQPVTQTHSPFSDLHIKEFMSFYRIHFPNATVTPQLHMLEEHTVPFLQPWDIGFGFMGEQGAESIHNSIEKYYIIIIVKKPPPKSAKLQNSNSVVSLLVFVHWCTCASLCTHCIPLLQNQIMSFIMITVIAISGRNFSSCFPAYSLAYNCVSTCPSVVYYRHNLT